ncbi:YNR064C-like protein [Saccharomyces cerevisiae x Saccharomyces kudriavzevii VIN7]|uniref:YNR064C-like protein n=1 Tax=Saccharomyces cerevisiae x Saccharomyces kudriavzevii (strain VIN7) TaxID=1095631 RepID=H0H0L5_SACCK|nr:YNR064C-like protein [Saccharomyces cerevisiae x Saccharomyces kudriavzevii VIN7]
MSSIIATFHKIRVQDGAKVWYREAGVAGNPTIVLLHGFPSSSNMFRNLIPLLASQFHVIAPDLPGFGFSETPDDYTFSFDALSDTVGYLLDALKIEKYFVYIFDYGSPVGFRLALKNPSKITAIISQNGNAYEEGLDDRFWGPLKAYWKSYQSDPAFVEALSSYVQDPANVISQYHDGVADIEAVDPAAYTLDIALMQRTGQTDIQLELFFDYQNNVKLYPEFQQFLRDSNIPVLVAWGANDTIFSVAGAEGYRKDVDNLKIVYYDTGHFALETHVVEIAEEIISMLGEDSRR